MNEEQEINNAATPEPVSEQPKTLADLFKEADTAETPPKEIEAAAAEKPKKNQKPKSLKDLAERLELEDKDLYAIEFPMSNGESRTLGQVKDEMAKQEDFAVRQLQWESEREKRENELLRHNSELKLLVSKLPKDAVKPEVLQLISKQHNEYVSRERKATVEAIPDWASEETRTKETIGIAAWMEEYGYPKNAIETLHDHRLVKLLRDSWRRKVREDNVLGKVNNKPQSGTTSRAQSAAPKKPNSQPKRTNTNEPNRGLKELFE